MNALQSRDREGAVIPTAATLGLGELEKIERFLTVLASTQSVT
jgi:hypothetical protein